MSTEPVKSNPTPAHFSHLRDKFVTIVAFGDSITQVNHWTYGGLNWVGMLPMGLYEVFPKGQTIINSGVGGDSLTNGLTRLDRDVLRFNPDIAILSFGMNDCRTATPEKFHDQLCETISRIRANGPASIILRTPNPMVDMFTGKELNEVPEGEGKYLRTNLGAYSEIICAVARKEKTLLVDHYALWKESMKSSCVGDIIMLMGNPIHPNHLGHRRLYHELAPTFNAYRNFFHEWERILRDGGRIP